MVRREEGAAQGHQGAQRHSARSLCTSLLGAWAGVGIREGFTEVAGAEASERMSSSDGKRGEKSKKAAGVLE